MDFRPPAEDLPEELPVLALREFVVFPYMVLPLFVARERSISAIEEAVSGDRLVLLVAQRNAETTEPDPDDLHRVGTVAMIMRSQRMPDGRLKVLVQGLGKARIDSVIEHRESTWVRATAIEPDSDGADDWTVEGEALSRAVRARVEELLPLKNLPPEVLSITTNAQSPGRLADLVASNLRLRIEEAQEILETRDALARLRRVDALLKRELELGTAQADYHEASRVDAGDDFTRDHREAFLREQLRAIQNELGEVDPRADEFEEYRLKVEEATLPEEAREEAMRQLRRLERMHPDGPEAQVVRNYLDWVVELPWDRCSPDRLDLEDAREILDRDHAHLSIVKDRILEFLGVRKLRSDSRGPILCFAGPPGVGKTSLGRSIARAMGREFVRVSLGGVRDEAEIRGHRRTYVGALPGPHHPGPEAGRDQQPGHDARRARQARRRLPRRSLGGAARGPRSRAEPGLQRPLPEHALRPLAGALHRDGEHARADPGAAARSHGGDPALGYTPEEKTEIATSFLIPRQVEEHGMTDEHVSWTRNAIGSLCSEYTHEAGVRNLERQVAAICRKVARKRAEGDESQAVINSRALDKLLGPPPFRQEHAADGPDIGLVNGLAWTEAGGEVLSLEANLSRGRGLVLTGQLGDVMKESGQAALSWVRSVLAEIGVDERDFGRQQVHVHVPAGATPKDGPSAGVAIATAIASLATGTPVRSDVAMTGEVTLRGRVLPVGGVREKALAALRSGISTIVIPESNVGDLREIPKELKKRIDFVTVKHMREVLDCVLVSPLEWRARPRATASAPIAQSSVPVHADAPRD